MDLTDNQWNSIRSHLPPVHTGRGRPPVDMRALLNGIFWKLRNNAPWRQLPSRYPSHQTCYRHYCEWKSSRLFIAILISLYSHLIYQGGFHPCQAIKNRQIALSFKERKFKFFIAPECHDDWRVHTALLLLQVMLPGAVKNFRIQAKSKPPKKISDIKLFFPFSMWPHFAPLEYETYCGPEDIYIPIT